MTKPLKQPESNNENNAITPLNDGILFTFTDQVKGGYFKEKTNSGIIVDLGTNFNYSSQYSRKGIVKAVGKSVKNVAIGDVIVIKHLMWSHSATVYDETKDPVWLTTERNVIGKMV